MVSKNVISSMVLKLKEDGIAMVQFKNCIKVICDARNEANVIKLLANISTDRLGNPSVLVSSDRMINQCIKDLPEVAWDMLDYATTPLIMLLEGGQFVNKHLLSSDNNIAIQMVKEGVLKELTVSFNRPLASFDLKELPETISATTLDNRSNNWVEKIIRIRLNNEVEIISS